MMDLHILVVISCVFLASLFSWLFISKFFRRKTFDEVLAEKKALSDKINAHNKAAAKKPKKLQSTKKELKREKRQQRQKEEKKDLVSEHDDTDTQSEKASIDDDQPGLSKTHVEFEPDPIVLSQETVQSTRRASNAEKEQVNSIAGSKHKSKKDKKSNAGKAAAAAAAAGANTTGILVNKNEPIAIKPNPNVDETLNNFEEKPPKDVIELKKAEKKEEKAQVSQLKQQQQPPNQGKKEKHSNKKEKAAPAVNTNVNANVNVNVEPRIEAPQVAAKEVKQQEEKIRQPSPKIVQNGHNNNHGAGGHKNKQQNKKQGNKESSATRDIMQALDKLSDTDSISVSLLMNLFRRSELNRSEIQILIDYLLNKQQDTPDSHSEWSDDICLKLKRQLEEKERALTEEQEASVGLQAKLRELRTEINSERLQMNANIKSYTEKLLSKDQELNGLNQELQAVNEKLNLERQQFQAKLLREKQASSQDMLPQLQLMQNELAHKDQCINDLVNASRQAVEESQQKNDIIQSQAQQILALEQQRDELEQVSNNRVFELEKVKELETENSEIKVELRNLQNEMESTKVDVAQARKDSEAIASEKQLLHVQNVDLQQKLALMTNKKDEQQSKEQMGMQATLNALRIELAEKEKQLTEFVAKNTELLQQHASNAQNYGQQQQELQQRIDLLTTEAANKQTQMQDIERIHANKYSNRETELLQQLQEQKEKNNDLRMKNWKLVEALQNAEKETLKENKMLSNNKTNLVQHVVNLSTSNSSKDEQHLRELLQRLYPDAVKACTGSALSLPFDQWIEQVLETHVKQLAVSAASNTNSSNKSTQSNGSTASGSSNHNSSHNLHKNNSLIIESSAIAAAATAAASFNKDSNSSRTTNQRHESDSDPDELQKENSQLRAQNEELTRLLMKTSNVLSDLEGHAREQDENWRSIVRSKDDQIHALQHSNGEQVI